jgi:hypothetical protein
MMNKQFAELQVYPIGGGIAFGLPGTTTPFLALPSGQATIKPWGTSGFLFENILTGDVIAFVSEYDDVLDNTDAPYAGDQQTVFIALAAFFFDLGGGGASDLAGVLNIGNTSGSNDISFDAFYGLFFANASRLREGTIDAGLGGNRGIAEICGLGYESKWEGGVRYIMGSSGNTIRQSLYNFLNTPTAAEDSTKGYQIGSLWTLDNGDTYYCADNTMGAAIWVLQQNAVPTLDQILSLADSANSNPITDLGYLDFDTAAAHTVVEGELAWNDSHGTLDLGLKGGNTISNLGQHIHARVVNKTTPLVGLTKAGYEVVIVAGATGQRLSVKLARADSDINSAGTLGIVCENIAGNQEGFICSVGQVTKINTTGSLQGETWADGDSLYLSGTTFGAITNVKPTAPIHEVRIGYVEYAHAINGKIYVKIDNGYEIDELHNVAISTPANNDALVYESATALWKNKTIGGWSYIVKSANQDVTNSATLVDDSELQFSVVAGGQYMTQLDLCYAGNNITADMKTGFLISAGTMKGSGIVVGFSTASTPSNNQSMSVNGTSAAGPISIGVVQADLDNLVTSTITFNFTASANGILKFQFANNSAAVGAISRIVKGSILKYKKIN